MCKWVRFKDFVNNQFLNIYQFIIYNVNLWTLQPCSLANMLSNDRNTVTKIVMYLVAFKISSLRTTGVLVSIRYEEFSVGVKRAKESIVCNTTMRRSSVDCVTILLR